MNSMPNPCGPRVLSFGDASAVVDPARGGEIISARLGDNEILSAMKWPRAARPESLVLDEDTFTAAWGGGWQLAFPNAGNPCTFRGREYGFHGTASFRPWSVADQSPSSLQLELIENDLYVARRITVLPDGFLVSTEVATTGSEPAAFIAAEHLVLGQAITDSGYRVELPNAELVDLYDPGRPQGPWPGAIDRHCGTRWDNVASDAKVSRFGAVGPLPVGAARVHPGGEAVTLDVRWDAEALPYVWIWQERDRDPRPPWSGCTQALGIEPSTVPTDDGIAAAELTGHLAVVRPGEMFSWWISLRRAGPGTELAAAIS